MTRHSQRASPALRAMVEVDPAIAALSLWCVHRDGDSTQTTGDIVSYGADFSALALHEQIGLAAHHVLHVALRHPARLATLQDRLGARCDAPLFNLAADAIVNETLLLGDHALPRPAVTLTGLLEQATGTAMAPQAALAAWNVERLYFALSTGQNDGLDGGKSETVQRAKTYAKQQDFQEDMDPAAGDDMPDEAQDADWRQHLARALAGGRQAGRGIGRIGHLITDIPAPRIPWEAVLRRLLTNAVTVLPTQNPHRPARRWIASAAQTALSGAPEQGFEAGQKPLTDVPRIVIAIDASGSIDDARLALFWGEVTGIARRMRAERHLLVFDDQLRHREKIDPAQTQITLPDMPRGGGTDFIPVIQEAIALNAAALVILTDLEGDAGLPPRGLSVIWAVPDLGNQRAPYGHSLDLSQ